MVADSLAIESSEKMAFHCCHLVGLNLLPPSQEPQPHSCKGVNSANKHMSLENPEEGAGVSAEVAALANTRIEASSGRETQLSCTQTLDPRKLR